MLLIYSLLSYVRKKIESWLESPAQQAGNTLALNPQLYCQQLTKKHPLVKLAAKYVFP